MACTALSHARGALWLLTGLCPLREADSALQDESNLVRLFQSKKGLGQSNFGFLCFSSVTDSALALPAPTMVRGTPLQLDSSHSEQALLSHQDAGELCLPMTLTLTVPLGLRCAWSTPRTYRNPDTKM